MRYYSSTAGKMTLPSALNATATTFTLSSTAGLPGSTPFTLILDVAQPSEEIVTVTAVSGASVTVTRGEDGSTATAHPAGAIVRHGLSARDLRESREHEAGTTQVHGVSGSVVGTSDVQGLTNKNLSSATNIFPSSLTTDVELAAHAALTVTHGVTGAIVGTTNVQTLTNKTLNAPVVTGGASVTGGATVAGGIAVTGAVSSTDDVTLGDAATTTQPKVQWFRKATTGAKVYNGFAQLTDNGAASRLGLVLKEDGLEVGRLELLPDGTAQVGGLAVANVSAAKAGKRFHWGTATVTTAGAGIVAVTHGAGFTPSVVTVTASGVTWRFMVNNITGTTFRLNTFDGAGNPTNLVGIPIMFFCGE